MLTLSKFELGGHFNWDTVYIANVVYILRS